MKHSKIFLGITTSILAIAGVAAAKYYGPQKTRFYITSGLAACRPILSPCVTDVGTITCFGNYTNGLGQQFTGPLFTKGNPLQVIPTGANSCNGVSKIHYSGAQ